MERYEGAKIDDLTPNGPYIHVELYRAQNGFLFYRTNFGDVPTTQSHWDAMKWRRHGSVNFLSKTAEAAGDVPVR